MNFVERLGVLFPRVLNFVQVGGIRKALVERGGYENLEIGDLILGYLDEFEVCRRRETWLQPGWNIVSICKDKTLQHDTK